MPRIYSKEISGKVYRYKGATRSILEKALLFSIPSEMEDYLCLNCVIEPELDIDNCIAGIITELANDILQKSGMTEESTEEFQKESEEWIESNVGKLEVLMMGTLKLSLDEIKDLDPPDWYKSAAAAQMLAAAIYGLDIDKYMSITKEKSKLGKSIKTPSGKKLDNTNIGNKAQMVR